MGRWNAFYPPRMSLPPGPDSPRAVQTWRWLRRPTEFMEDCAARYGEIFSLRTYMDGDMVMTSNPEAIQQIFAANYDEVCQTKDEEFGQLLGRASLFILEGAEHQQMRRAVMPALSHAQMKNTVGLIRTLTEDALDAWPLGVPFSLRIEMQELLLQTTLQILFGGMSAARVQALGRLFSGSYQEFASPFMLAPINWQARVGLGPWVRMVRLARQSRAIITDEIRERRAREEDGGQDVMAALLRAQHPAGRALTDSEICDTLVALFIAGHDTTANALNWSFVCLLQEREACARLRDEICSVSAGSDWERILSLPLLDATVREILRLHPIFPAVTRTLSRPMRLLGYDLSVGMRVVPCIYLTQRRPDIFPEPSRFLPERFLNRRHAPAEWMPFGGGMRRCVGSALVPMQMKIMLAAILSRATLRSAPGPAVRTTRAFISLAPSGGVPVILTSRAPRSEKRAGLSLSGVSSGPS